MNKLLPVLKLQRPELSGVYAQVLQNIAKRVRDSYTVFFARRKAGLKAGPPRYKKEQRYNSLTYPQHPQHGFQIEGNRLHLSKIGDIKIVLDRPLRGTIKTLTVKRCPSGKWYAVFSCIVEVEPKPKPEKDVGIDVGLNSFAALSNGTIIENPRHYRNEERRLARLQRSLSRKKKGSNNSEKARVKVARLHEKIENRRADFLHKASRKIADTYETVYVEDLQIENMLRNHRLAKSISDAGWARFIGMIRYKEEESGGVLIKVNPRNTSQRCSRCGEIVEKSLSNRVHVCRNCGLELDRDLNAALNVLKRGREIGRVSPEFTPVGETTTTLPFEGEQAVPMNQEAQQGNTFFT